MHIAATPGSELRIKENKLLFMFLAFFILAPKYGLIDFTVVFLILSIAISHTKLSLNKNITLLITFFAVILIILLFAAIINSGFPANLIMKPVRLILISTLLFWIAKSNNMTIDFAFKVILLAGMINSTVVLLQFSFDFAGLDDTVLRFYPPGATEGSLRKSGLSAGFPPSGLLSAMSALIAIWFSFLEKKKIYLLLFVFCVPGMLLSSRTAIILFFILLPFIFWEALKKLNFKSITLFLIISSIISYTISLLSNKSEHIYNAFHIMFEFVFVFLHSSKIGTRSTDDLILNHYYLPDGGIREWLLGNSNVPYVTGEVASDVWFIQTLISSGILVMAIYLVAFFFLFYMSVYKCNKKYRSCSIIVFLIVFISSFKGSYIFSRFVGDTATLVGIIALAHISNLKMVQQIKP